MCSTCSTYLNFRLMKTTLMPYLSSVYFVNQPLHVSGIFVSHHQEVYYIYIYIYIYTTIGTCCDFQLTVCWPCPADGLQICPKHVEIVSVINQIDAQNFCFTISLFHSSTCFEHMCSSSGGQNCITQPLVSSHV